MDKKVFLNVLTSNSKVHSYHQELLTNPPIKYVNSEKEFHGFKDVNKNKGLYYLIKGVLNILKIPNMVFIKEKYDLVHSYNSLVVNNRPWILDFEMVGGLTGFNANRLNSKLCKSIIRKKLESDNCKSILPWSEAAKKSLLNYVYSKKIEEKIKVIYPTITPIPTKNKKLNRKGKVKLLFVGNYFLAKGGKEVLNVFDRLKKEHDIELIIVSQIPDNLNKGLLNKKDVTILSNIDREILYKKYFPEADIFILPTHYDTYGLVFLEAMSFGIPIVTTNLFATPEIIEHGKNGFLTNTPKISWFNTEFQLNYKKNHEKNWIEFNKNLEEFEDKELEDSLYIHCKTLIKNKRLRVKMGNEGLKIFNEKFSIEQRNKKLRELYQKILSSKH